MIKKYLKSKIFYMLIILIVLVGIILAFKKEIYNFFNNQSVNDITFISNNKFTDNNIINQAIISSHNQDKGYLEFNTKALAKSLSKNTWIKTVTVTKIWPNRLVINITEQKPFAYWTNGLQEGYLNEKGILFYSPQQQINNDSFRLKYQHKIKNIITNSELHVIPSISLNTSSNFPLVISNTKYISIGFDFWNNLTELLSNYNLQVRQIRINSVNSWEILLSNGIVLKLDDFRINKTLIRYLLASKQIPVPQDYYINYIDLRYNNGFAIKFVSKDEISKNPNLLIRSLAPGYGGADIPNASFAPDLKFNSSLLNPTIQN